MGDRYEYDFDWVIVGSGFGGGVSALRLAERGYSVCVLECGRRFAAEDLPTSTWDLRNYFWAPQVGLRGLLRMTLFKDVAIVSGSAVGGGSVVYAATLYRAADNFGPKLSAACGESVDLNPFYDEAERMLGVVDQPLMTKRDVAAHAVAQEMGYPDGFHRTRIGIYRGEPGRTVADPFFAGEGPERAGCVDCGGCIIGCRHNAKNSVDKNYLWLAERRGAQIHPERLVTDVRPLGASDGSDGYAVVSRRPGSWVRHDEQVLRARGVIVAAGAIGTNRLLANAKHGGSLPSLSPHLGKEVRTNAESVVALTARDPDVSHAEGVQITSSLWPREDAHIEVFSYGENADAMAFWFVPLTGDGTRVTRPLKLLGQIARHPRDTMSTVRPRGWSRRTISLGAMLAGEGSLRFDHRRRLLRSGVRLQTRQDSATPNPTFLPFLYEAVGPIAEKLDAIPQSWGTEALLNRPFTAHILGGAIIGTSPETGVVDARHRVYGYRNMLVCDGATVPANAGVNPSLTITAMAERAMSTMPAADSNEPVAATGVV